MTDRVRTALAAELPQGRLVFTAHSVPVSMAESSPRSVGRGTGACVCRRHTGSRKRRVGSWFTMSRSGPPGQPWLEPDILAHLREIRSDMQ